jgi:hypothetical protein
MTKTDKRPISAQTAVKQAARDGHLAQQGSHSDLDIKGHLPTKEPYLYPTQSLKRSTREPKRADVDGRGQNKLTFKVLPEKKRAKKQ